jgi:PAS domain S-box-containing protein
VATSPIDIEPATSTSSWRDEPFRRLVQTISDYAIFLLDAEGRIQSWNRGAELLKGYKPAEIIGKHFSVFYPKSAVDRGWPQHELETAKRIGRFEDEGWRVRKDGTRFWANVVITAMYDESGRLLGFSKVTRDLTERRNNEERMRQSEERFRLLLENVQDYAIFMLDPGGHVASWNAGAERLKGYTAAEIIGKHFSIFYPPEALARNWPAYELEQASKLSRFEDEGWRLRKDGTRFWANVVITALRDREGVLVGFSKITRDLTERRNTEERLRQSEERFRLLLEGVQDYAIMMLDPEGRVSSWNLGAESILGYKAPEVIGRSFECFYPPEDLAAGRPANELRTALLNRRAEDRGWRVRKDGTRFWADVVVTALYDSHGQLRGFAKVTRDLSERKRMEALEEQGRHLTEFMAMLAHELRNPLAPIRNAIGIMAMAGETSPQVNWCRDVIERQTMHLARLVDDLLDVSRITRGKLRLKTAPIDLRDAVASAVEATRSLFDARRQRLHARISDEPILVNGDITRLVQVMMNLLNNAAKYTQEGGEAWVDAFTEDNDAILRVRDNGMGIAPDMLDHVFDLFAQGERTIDRAEGGLGIGLTLARRIVALHGGSVVARSEGPGRGSEFEARLPMLRPGTEFALEKVGAAGLPRAGKRLSVLVVDDNTDAANSVAMLLRMAGHEVRVENDGPAALQSARLKLPQIVLLDIGLPGMNGHDVARELRASKGGSDMRIYAMTGYGQPEDIARSREAGFDGHLVKPVVPNELVALLDEAK